MATDAPIRIGMIGHGMMGVWHSENLAGLEAVPHTIVGRRDEPTRAFAERFGYAQASTDIGAMLADPEVDAVIVASPSEAHVAHSLAAIEANKHVLIEIPIAMDLAGAERVAAAAAGTDKVVAVCHPWRHRPEYVALKQRLESGEERLGFIEGRFMIHRLANVGATGYQRSWTDNILWHHATHLVDMAFWLMGDDLATTGFLGQVDPRTGTHMATAVNLERADGASAHILLTYLTHLKENDSTVVTDRDSYRVDIPRSTLTTREDSRPSRTSKRSAVMSSPTLSTPAGAVAAPGSRPRTCCPAWRRCKPFSTPGMRRTASSPCRAGNLIAWSDPQPVNQMIAA